MDQWFGNARANIDESTQNSRFLLVVGHRMSRAHCDRLVFELIASFASLLLVFKCC
jgi:hypothetical protein